MWVVLSFIMVLNLSPASWADTSVNGRISTDTTWTLAGSPYIATSTVQVYGTTSTPVTLTIEPGVVVKFNSGIGLQIGSGANQGALVSRGTDTSRITFTRSGASGTWAGITFYDGTVDGTTALEYSDVQYSTGIVMTSASPTIRNSTITDVIGYGMNLSTSNPTLQNVTISSANNYGMNLSSSNPVMDNVLVTANGAYGIYLSSSSPIITGGSLTNTSATGHGMYGSGSPIISNYNVSIANTVNYYGIYLASTTSALSLTNSVIANGLYVNTTGILPTITGNTFTNADNSSIHAGANIIAGILDANTVSGLTAAGKIDVVGEIINRDTQWKKWAAPYNISGLLYVYKDATTAATLTIDPGVVLKFSSGLQIGNGTSKGALVAQGTSNDHITFTRSGTSGNWSTFAFNDGTVDNTTILEFADIQYSSGIAMTSASPIIRNSTITDVNGSGLSLTSSNPTIDTVTITSSGTYGIYLLSSSPVISGGSLTNTSAAVYGGIYGSGSPTISNYSVSISNIASKYGINLGTTTSSLSITNSTIANGLYLSSVNITPTITGNTFSNSDNSPIHAGANIIAAIMTNNTVNGMTSAGRIEVAGEQIKQDVLWKKWDAPYVVSGTVSIYKDTTSASTLTIEAGTVLKFDSGVGMQVGPTSGTSKGCLVAQGTSGSRITFTRSGTSGTWAGITFNDGTVDSATILENVDVQYTSGIVMNTASPTIRNSTVTNVTGWGMNLTSSNPILDNVTISNSGGVYGIYLSSSSPIITGGNLANATPAGSGIVGSGSPVISNFTVSVVNAAGNYGINLSTSSSALSITNSTIGNGLFLGATGITPTITGNTFTNYDTSPLRAGAMIASQILDNNTFTGMTSASRIEVLGDQVIQDTRWKKWMVPYVVISGTIAVYKDAITPVTLTIDPGVLVKFMSGAIQIGWNANLGALVARGTAADRIIFTRNGTSGNWSTITFNDGTIDATTVLEYVDIQYSNGIVMNSASPTIRNSTLTDVTNGYNGLSLTSSNPTIDTVTISNSGSSGISLASSSPIINGGSLTNNYSTGGQGINGSGSPVISNYAVSIVNTAGKYGIYLNSGSTSALSVTNSTISNGLYLGTTGIIPTITGNTFTNVDNSPIRAGANVISQILNNNTLTGMTAAGRIEVVGENVNRDSHWIQQAAPYVVVSGTVAVYKDTTGPATLTIDPGVTVKFASAAGLQVASGASQGALVAQGTAGNRITLARNDPSGNWGGITFNDGTMDNSTILENLDIQHSSGITMNTASPTIRNSTITNVSGYGMTLTSSNPTIDTVVLANNGTYGISLSSSSPVITGGSLANASATGNGIYGNGSPGISNYSVSIVNSAGKYGVYLSSGCTSSLSITNSTIANGLFLGTTGCVPTISGNTFTNVDNSPLRAGANVIGQILSNNTINGMTSAGRIDVLGEVISRDSRWILQAAPYVVSGTVSVYKDATTSATLTIDPGVIVKFGANVGMQIGNSSGYKGVLNAKGTAAYRILFTSSQTTPTAGYWSGISFFGDAASSSVVEQATIEYAGSGGASTGNITLNSTSPVIRNCTIRNSSQSGIYASSAQNWPVIIDSEVTGNKWGVYSSSSNPYVTNTKITGNTTAGVWNASTNMDVDARDNWWGLATGPTHSTNPTGTGDKVSDHVIYNPWLGQAPGTALRITEAKVLPASMNPDGDYVTFTAMLSSSATWTITITDANSVTVKTFSGTGTTVNQKWYGENSQSVKVSDGVYYYRMDAMDAGGNTASWPQGMVMVSRLIPIAIMDPPSDNQMFQCGSTINITGTAADSTDFNNFTIAYGIGENPTTWTNLKTSTTSTTNGLLYAWNTSALTGYVYTVRLTVTDNAGNIAIETSRVRFLCIQNAALSDAYLSPNADGVKDTTTISATFTHLSNWTITIKDASSAAVRTFSNVATSATQTWDGKDNGGSWVPDGTYTYQIDAVGSGTSTAAVPRTGTIVVDTTSPAAQITAPVTNAVLHEIVPILGTAADLYLATYRLEYGPPSGAGPWNVISSATTSVNNGTLAMWVTSDPANGILVANGSYLLKLSVSDQAGNTSIVTVPISADNLIISNVGVSSNMLHTNAAETSTVFFNINSQATVTFNIIPEKQGPTGTPVYQAGKLCAAGASSFSWDGRDNTGRIVPDEAYLFILAASDGTGTGGYNPPAPTGTGTVTCTQSAGLDPVSNQPMIVTYTPAQPSRVNINIDWASQNFKILDAFPVLSGNHTFVWDGRNQNGDLLDNGAKASCSAASLLRENFIITTGDAVKISEVKTDPYMIHLAYGQLTRIKYTLSRDANITIKLTSPSGAVITLFNNQAQSAGAQEVDWNGMDATDTAGMKTLITEGGDYMVSVQAVNPVTGTSSTAKTNVRIGY
jgi:flagellar hook assembly protein FlgD